MTGMPMNWAHELGRPKDKPAVAEISPRLRLVGAMLRTIFILAILVIIVEVSLPQSETIWTAYDTPADLVRMALGLIVGGVDRGAALHYAQGCAGLSDVAVSGNCRRAVRADLRRCSLVELPERLTRGRNAVANAAMARIRFRVRRSCKPVLSDDLTCLR